MPSSFEQEGDQLFLPLAVVEPQSWFPACDRPVARGVTTAAAQDDLDRIAEDQTRRYPRQTGVGVNLIAMHGAWRATFAPVS
jgi:hypothetical protein